MSIHTFSLPTSYEEKFSVLIPGDMTVMTEEFPAFAALAISPNLQALLEFDDRLQRTSGESYGRSETTSAGITQPGQYPSWRQQEVPTVSLPPPRRKKSVVTDVPMSPNTVSEYQSAPSLTDTFSGIGEFGGLGEIVFARPEGVFEDEMELESKDYVNPYLNPPPSPPRYFYPRSDDEEGIDQPSPLYTLEKSRSTRRSIRQRAFASGDQSSAERKGGRLVSPRYFTSFGRQVGSRPKERGSLFLFPFLILFSPLPLHSKVLGPRAVPTRPLLLHSHKASLSSRSHQVRPSV